MSSKILNFETNFSNIIPHKPDMVKFTKLSRKVKKYVLKSFVVRFLPLISFLYKNTAFKSNFPNF